MKENWKDIKGYEGIYQVSDKGRIKNVRTGRILKTHPNKKGYLMIRISDGKERKGYGVHRLVAEAFIPNPDNLPQVNHKDENKLNNNVDNLEWCTLQYNVNYGTARQRMSKTNVNNPKKCKPIAQYTLDYQSELIKVWPSGAEIERKLNFFATNVMKCCKGEIKQAYGYQWAYWKE